MTVAAAAAKAGPYTGNDVTSSFAFAFKVFADSDILVVETLISTSVETDLVLNTNYTVSRNVDQDNDPGGTITYKVGGVTTALPSTKKLTIVGNFTYEQPSDIPNGGAFQASVIELALDRTQLHIKQLAEQMARAVKVPVSSTTDPDDLVASVTASEAAAVASAAAAAVSETNAGTSETNAAASAAAASTAAASIGYKDVVFLTSADSPYTVAQATSGKLLSIDTSGGAVTVSLPAISGLTLPFVVGVKKSTNDANAITVNRAGSDTFDDGATAKTITGLSGLTLIPDTDTAPDVWSVVAFGSLTGEQKKQQFTAGVDYTAGTSTTITLTETPVATSKDSLEVFFDTAYQQESEWSYSAGTGVITFTSAIPVGVAKIEAKWATPLSIGTPSDATVTAAKLASPLGGAINESQAANIASAATVDLDAADGNYAHITGTTTITAITLAQGAERTVVFDGALTLTNGASLILPSGANITTAAGDVARLRGEAAGVVRCVGYMRADGMAVVSTSAANPSFSAYPSGSQVLGAGTTTKILFATEAWDTNSNFASSRFTPTTAGYYQLNVAIDISGGATGQNLITIYKNGAAFKHLSDFNSSTHGLLGSCQVSANGTTDYFEVYVYTANGFTTGGAGSAYAWFDGAFVRPA
jgi:hypothetical protein